MKFSTITIIIFLIISILSVILAQRSSHPKKKKVSKPPCSKITLQCPNTLIAECKDKSSKKINSDLDLNKCFGTTNGVLGKGKDFSKVCKNCSYFNKILRCQCNKADGTLIHTKINVINYIKKTKKGQLECTARRR